MRLWWILLPDHGADPNAAKSIVRVIRPSHMHPSHALHSSMALFCIVDVCVVLHRALVVLLLCWFVGGDVGVLSGCDAVG